MSNSWPRVSLGELLRLARRPVEVEADKQYQEIGIYCFGRGIFHKAPRSGLEVGEKDIFLLKEGDFILQVTFAWEGAVAIVSAAENGMYGSTRYPTFRVDETRCVPLFLLNYFKTHEGLEQLVRICPGSAGRNRVLSIKRIPEVQVPLPSVAEQRRIVGRIEELASQIHEASTLRHQAAEEAEALYGRQSDGAMKPHGEGWKRETVADVIESIDAGWSPQCDDVAAAEGMWGVLKTTAVQWCDFLPHHNKALPKTLEPNPPLTLKEGDVLVTRAGPRKRVAVVAAVHRDEPRLMISDKLIRLRTKRSKIDPRFLELSLASPFSQEHLINRKTGLADAQVNISQAILKTTPVAYPSLREQRRIVCELAAFQTQVNTLKRLQDETAAEIDALLPSILDRAFDGDIILDMPTKI
jgi:type I restriction enzyme S subunit